MASILNVDKIRATGSTTDGLTVDSSGRVLTPARPAFHAFPTNGVTTLSTGINTLVCGSTNFNQGNHYSTSTGKFTVPISGMYQFGVSLSLRPSSTTSNYNSAEIVVADSPTSAENGRYVGGWMAKESSSSAVYKYVFQAPFAYLTAGATVIMGYEAQAALDITGGNSGRYSYFYGYLVG